MDSHDDHRDREITARIDEDSPLVTRGVRANAGKHLTITFSGRGYYSLLPLLEEYAVSAEDYTHVRALVLWDEKIRQQLAAQGF